ncbi:hypothetical protein HAX54_012259 [Datura stramonium]|uniref:Uncharacterized protein n=1 Tax=Datura stramonium TaxID=4076 RepID=A0ABS8Y100_DATST|nr:hypothetical protein [Datura stramonium]
MEKFPPMNSSKRDLYIGSQIPQKEVSNRCAKNGISRIPQERCKARTRTIWAENRKEKKNKRKTTRKMDNTIFIHKRTNKGSCEAHPPPYGQVEQTSFRCGRKSRKRLMLVFLWCCCACK